MHCLCSLQLHVYILASTRSRPWEHVIQAGLVARLPLLMAREVHVLYGFLLTSGGKPIDQEILKFEHATADLAPNVSYLLAFQFHVIDTWAPFSIKLLTLYWGIS